MKSSASFWLATAALVAGAVLLEGNPDRSPQRTPLAPSQSLLQFLRGATDPSPSVVKMRKVTPDGWAGWRFRTSECEATIVPLLPGGEYDVDAQRLAAPGDRLAYVYRGGLYAKAPIALSTFHRLFDRAWSSRKAQARDYYYGLIAPAGCQAPFRLPWAKLPAWPAEPR